MGKKIRGAGDLVSAAATKLFGETNCLGCKQRQAAWNHWLPLSSPPPIRHSMAAEEGKPVLLINAGSAKPFDVRRVVRHIYDWQSQTRADWLAMPLKCVAAGSSGCRDAMESAIGAISWRNATIANEYSWLPSVDRSAGLIAVLESVSDTKFASAVYVDVVAAARDFRKFEGAFRMLRRGWAAHAAALRDFGAAGLFRHGRRSWEYIGGAFALRLGVVFERNWRYIPSDNPDRWLSAMFRPSEAAAIAADFLGRDINKTELEQAALAFYDSCS